MQSKSSEFCLFVWYYTGNSPSYYYLLLAAITTTRTVEVYPLPSRPWRQVAADLRELGGKYFLVFLAGFSGFIDIVFPQSITRVQVIGETKNMFARWGIPGELVSDNGTQFTWETFQIFATNHIFRLIFSSQHYPHSNEEAAVNISKRIPRQDDIFKALLSYDNPLIYATGQSPTELMTGRKLRTSVPTLNPRGRFSSWFTIQGADMIDDTTHNNRPNKTQDIQAGSRQTRRNYGLLKGLNRRQILKRDHML